VEFGGEVSTVRERETIVFERRDGSWLAVHEHLSPETAE
jgi:ketosteroid isomerase-like protein